MKVKKLISTLLVATTLVSTLAFSVNAQNAAEVMTVYESTTVSSNKAKKEVEQDFVLSASSYGSTGWTSDEKVYFSARYVGPSATSSTQGTQASYRYAMYGSTSAKTAYLDYMYDYGYVGDYYKVAGAYSTENSGSLAKVNVAWQP